MSQQNLKIRPESLLSLNQSCQQMEHLAQVLHHTCPPKHILFKFWDDLQELLDQCHADIYIFRILTGSFEEKVGQAVITFRYVQQQSIYHVQIVAWIVLGLGQFVLVGEVGRVQYWLLHRIVSSNVRFLLHSTESFSQRTTLAHMVHIVEASLLIHGLITHVTLSCILYQLVRENDNSLLKTLQESEADYFVIKRRLDHF